MFLNMFAQQLSRMTSAMDTTILAEIFLLLILFFVLPFFYKRWNWRGPKSAIPFNWPVVGMLPDLFLNRNRFHDYVTEILRKSGSSFNVKGAWLSNTSLLLTCDPTNTHYILSKQFSNFSKGPDFTAIFDVLGEGIFNSDSKSWETQRKTAMLLLNHRGFQKFVQETNWKKMENGLMPLLQSVSEQRTEVDLQQVFQRFTFDATCILVLGHDPVTLSVDMPYVSYDKGFGDAEQAMLYRHMLPEFYWKFQRWLQIGLEKKLSDAFEAIHEFILHCITLKRDEMRRRENNADRVDDHQDLLTSYMMEMDENNSILDKGFRDKLLNLLFAGRDTVSAALTWLFWLIATNPFEENKILEEVIAILKKNGDGNWRVFNAEELKSMVYLHGAICEALRLYPPVALQHKAPLQSDTLPSGHLTDKHARTVISFYSMGRMESIWGKDCLEFKPERWITEQGGIKHEPSYKFTAFNAGPRTCLGKEMTFIQMKIVAASIIFHYKVEVVEGQSIYPSDSVILHMMNGLKVRITKRCTTQSI